MWIDFNSDRTLRVRFVFRVLVDLTAQLVRAFAVHAPRLTSPCGFDLAQPLKEQHTARIFRTDVGNDAGDLVGCILIHTAHMSPELLVAVLALDRLARLPLFFRNALEMPEACLIKPVISHKHRFDDRAILAHGDYREILDIEVDGHGHQVRVLFAFFDLFRLHRI